MVGKKEKQGFKAMFKRMLASRLAAGIAAALAALLLLVIVGLGIRSVVLSESKSTKLGFENIGELATQTGLLHVGKCYRRLKRAFWCDNTVYTKQIHIQL